MNKINEGDIIKHVIENGFNKVILNGDIIEFNRVLYMEIDYCSITSHVVLINNYKTYKLSCNSKTKEFRIRTFHHTKPFYIGEIVKHKDYNTIHRVLNIEQSDKYGSDWKITVSKSDKEEGRLIPHDVFQNIDSGYFHRYEDGLLGKIPSKTINIL